MNGHWCLRRTGSAYFEVVAIGVVEGEDGEALLRELELDAAHPLAQIDDLEAELADALDGEVEEVGLHL